MSCQEYELFIITFVNIKYTLLKRKLAVLYKNFLLQHT